MLEVSIETCFAAAHHLRDHRGPCENAHGHNWRVEVAVRREGIDRTGMVIDFRELKRITREILDRDFEHKYLNHDNESFRDDGLNPTAENIARVLFRRIGAELPEEVKIAYIRVWETPESATTYRERGSDQ